MLSLLLCLFMFIIGSRHTLVFCFKSPSSLIILGSGASWLVGICTASCVWRQDSGLGVCLWLVSSSEERPHMGTSVTWFVLTCVTTSNVNKYIFYVMHLLLLHHNISFFVITGRSYGEPVNIRVEERLACKGLGMMNDIPITWLIHAGPEWRDNKRRISLLLNVLWWDEPCPNFILGSRRTGVMER